MPRHAPDPARRSLLKRALLAGGASLLAGDLSAIAAPAGGTKSLSPAPAGASLGSWLVLEKWMAPSAFAGSDATDEYTLCKQLGAGASAHLKAFQDRFITDADFAWIADRGLGAVRLPVGYWVLDGDSPYVASPATLT